MGEHDVQAKLDHALGVLTQISAQQIEQGRRLDEVGARIGRVEDGVAATKDVVDAWGAARTSFRFAKWLAGFVAALVAVFAAMKGWVHK